MRAVRSGPQAVPPVFHRPRGSLEPDPHLGIALEGEDVGRDPVEEPAVVRDHHGAAGEVEQCIPRARSVSTSRSLVGSSSSSRLPPVFSSLARWTWFRSPPEHADLALLVGA